MSTAKALVFLKKSEKLIYTIAPCGNVDRNDYVFLLFHKSLPYYMWISFDYPQSTGGKLSCYFSSI